MPRYKLSSKAGVVHVDGSLSAAKLIAGAIAKATGSEVHGEAVSAPKRRRRKAAPKPARRKKRRAKAKPARSAKRRTKKSSSKRRKAARKGRRRS